VAEIDTCSGYVFCEAVRCDEGEIKKTRQNRERQKTPKRWNSTHLVQSTCRVTSAPKKQINDNGIDVASLLREDFDYHEI